VLSVSVGGTVQAGSHDSDNATGVSATHAGTGNTAITSSGTITATGTDSIGLNIDTSGGGDFSLDITAGTISGDGTSVNINTGTGTSGTVNIAQGATVGADSSTQAINIGGSGSGNVTNAGSVFGGVNVLGNFTNTTTGAVTMTGSQTFFTSGNLVNNGVINAINSQAGDTAISVGGNLSGTGTFVLDVDFTTGQTDQITVDGSVLAGSNLTIDANVVSGQVTQGNASLLSGVIVADTVEAGASLLVNAGLVSVNLTGDGQGFSAPVVQVSDKGQVYVAAPVALASNFSRIASTQTRLHNRVYARQGSASSSALSGFVPNGTGVQVASLDGLMWLAYANELSRAAPQSAHTLAPSQSGAWASLSTERLKHSRTTGALLKDSYHEFEGGLDRVLPQTQGAWVLSGSAHVGRLSSKVANPSGSESSVSATGLGVGAGATFYWSGGTYFDANARLSQAKSDIGLAGVQVASGVKSRSYTGSLELGHRHALGGLGAVTPSVQLLFGQTLIEGFTDSQALKVESSTQKTHKARVGVMYENALPVGSEGSTYRVSLNYTNDLSPTSRISAGGTTLASKGKRDWLDVGVGATLLSSGNSRITFDTTYSFAKGARSTNNGLRATVGYQLQF
jgi:hypothetical protein